MSDHKPGPMSDELSKPTSVFGLRLWVILGVCVGTGLVLVLFLITLWIASKRNKNSGKSRHQIPIVSKEIQEIKIDNPMKPQSRIQVHTHPFPYQDMGSNTGKVEGEALLLMVPESENDKGCIVRNSCETPRGGDHGGTDVVAPDVSHLGWGHWYTLRELEVATHGFSAEKVVGEGGYGIVYHGVLADNTHVAVKNLLNNRGQAEREFKVEVEAIGRVRHKNLVRLLGYCAEGAHRLLVYEFVSNGNLEQWLHGDVGPCSPLTWDIRMNVILGTAKGLTYLHEGLEPKVVHRDIKSGNILLDQQWNSKVSDFGLAKLLYSERSFITTRVMGTFGYVAPEYASTGMLNETSDVYSLGILIMEIISGRNPVDYSRPPDEVNLIDWIKKMVTERNPEGVLDPKLPETPTLRALKRTLLVALRCVDPNAQKRPKMGHIVHMLEADESLSKECHDRRGGRELLRYSQPNSLKNGSTEKQMPESDSRSGTKSDMQEQDKERG